MAEHPRIASCPATAPDPAESAPLRLLLVEDNPADAELVAEHLDLAEALEVEIERVARLEAAIEATRGGLVDAVLLRSEERRVGKECFLLCRSRWSPYH